MPKLSDDPGHWRKLAEEARAQAEEFTEDWKRRIMLRIARDYERLAEEAEEAAPKPAPVAVAPRRRRTRRSKPRAD
jgi:hypothetical protein